MRGAAFRRIIVPVAVAALIPACGGGGGGGGGAGSGASISVISLTPGSTSGSSAPGTANGGTSGSFSVFSRGNIHFGQVSPPAVPALPTAPTTGTVVTTAMLAAPPAQFGAEGNLLVNGNVTSPGTGTINIVASAGDVVVSGALQSGGVATPDSIFLGAPNGTVYVSGSIRTSLGLGAGASGASLQIVARRIIITGSIDTRGDTNVGAGAGDGGPVNLVSSLAGATSVFALGSINTSAGPGTNSPGGSFAGDINILANDEVWIGGSITARGGDATGTADALASGSGAGVIVNGAAGVFINCSIDLSGGNVSTTGTGTANGFIGAGVYGIPNVGDGGSLFIDSLNGPANPSGPVYFFGSFTSNGGSASAAKATTAKPICAGDSGSVFIGGSSPSPAPVSVDFGSGLISLPGGNSDDFATGGGAVDIENNFAVAAGAVYQGDIIFTGSMDLSNGTGGNTSALDTAGAITIGSANGDVSLTGSMTLGGGSASGNLTAAFAPFFSVYSGAAGTQGGIFSSATITANGPSSSTSVGGVGGTVKFQVLDIQDTIILQPGSVISANGGSGGGNGGTISLQTASDGTGSGTISVSGQLTALGGNSGTAGGRGGRFFVDSCTSGGSIGGDVRLETGSLVDLSGGSGAPGGSAQNNGGAVAPPSRTPAGNFTTCLEIWTHGSGLTPAEPVFPAFGGGRLINNGLIRANGGSVNGNGGDMNIDAFQSDGSATVTLVTVGNVSNAGTGLGTTGIITVH